MFGVQLFRVSVHGRISAAAEDFLLQVENRGEPAPVAVLRALLTERLTAAAEEIVGVFAAAVERTERDWRLLDAALKPRVALRRVDTQQQQQQQQQIKEEDPPVEQQQWNPVLDHDYSALPQDKEEPNSPWIHPEEQCLQGSEETDVISFTLTSVSVKSEDEEGEEPQASQLHQRHTDENGGNCGETEAAAGSGPDEHPGPGPGPEVQLEKSREAVTDSREDVRQQIREHQAASNPRPYNLRVSATKGEYFICCVCDQRFSDKRQLQEHRSLHTEERPYKCPKCGKGFRQKWHLKGHVLIHTRKARKSRKVSRALGCPACLKGFGRSGHVNTHMWPLAQAFICPKCGKTFKHKNKMKMHMLVHASEVPFRCPECGKGFYYKTSLKRHMWAHTGESRFSCPECGKGFYEKRSMTRHVALHACAAQSGRRPGGKHSADKAAPRKRGVGRAQAPSRPVCGKGSRREENLRTRSISDGGDRGSGGFPLNQDSSAGAGEKRFRCVCGEVFGQTAEFEAHMSAQTRDKPFSCIECGDKFKCTVSLIKHIKIHMETKTL